MYSIGGNKMITDRELKDLNKSLIKLLLRRRQSHRDLELSDIKLKKESEFTSYIGYRFYYFNLQCFYIKKIKEIEFRYAVPESVNKCGKSFIGKDGKFMVYANQLQIEELYKYIKNN